MSCSRLLFLGFLAFLLVACAGQDRRDPSYTQWATHLDNLQQLQHWTATGKLALRNDTASESASLLWQQHQQNTHLQLSGPLGVGTTVVDSDGRQLEIRRGGEYQIMDISTRQSIVLNTGWDLPLAALPYWLKGIPSPNFKIEAQEVDVQSGLLNQLQQDGWEIRFQRYEQFQTYILPVRLQIERGATRVTLLIRNWQDFQP